MERTMISFSLPNIITITLAAAIGYAGLAIISQFILNRSGSVS